MNAIQLIEETVAYYSEDVNRRSKVDKACMYLASDGRKCAVGRIMTDEALHEYGGNGCDVHGLIHEAMMGRESADWTWLIREEYREIKQLEDLLNDLQDLHDDDNYWTKGGLSYIGRSRVEILKDRYQ